MNIDIIFQCKVQIFVNGVLLNIFHQVFIRDLRLTVIHRTFDRETLIRDLRFQVRVQTNLMEAMLTIVQSPDVFS